MMKKGMSRLVLIICAFVVVLVIVFSGYFAYNYFFHGREITGEDTPSEKQDSETPATIENQEDFGEGEGAGGEGEEGAGGGGEGGESGAPEENAASSEKKEDKTIGSDVEPTATLQLLDFDYEIVEEDLVKVTSISYSVYNLNVGPMQLELLLYIYDEGDDNAKKGLVRAQLNIGELDYGEIITATSPASAYYRGDLGMDKKLKLTLIGYLMDQSYNLGSVVEEVVFE